MSAAPVARSILADQVKDRLLDAILSGEYPPDSRIVETRLARELGTSQAPVREALRGLAAIGVVELEPFRGARVRRPSVGELLEGYVVRSDLESLAARLGVPRMTGQDLDDLARLSAEMERAALADDRHAVAVADAAFHARMVRTAANSVLERVWQTLEPYSRTYLTLLVPGADPQWTAALHGPILDALRVGDVDEVVRALEHHFAEAEAMVARAWRQGSGEAQATAPAAEPGEVPAAVGAR